MPGHETSGTAVILKDNELGIWTEECGNEISQDKNTNWIITMQRTKDCPSIEIVINQ